MSDEIQLPAGAELAAEFPRGDIAKVLWKVREAITECAKDNGFTFTGAGIGCGSERSWGLADVGLVVDGHQIEITIDMPKKNNS